MVTKSVEPQIADLANGWLKQYKLDYRLEQQPLNSSIDNALNDIEKKNIKDSYSVFVNALYNKLTTL